MAFILAASQSCTGIRDSYGGSYSNYAELHEARARQHDAIVARIEALPRPLAENGIVMIPEITEWQEITRPLLVEIGTYTPENLTGNSRDLEATAFALPRYLQARGLFAQVTVVRGSKQPVETPPDTVVIRYGYDRHGVHLFMRAEAALPESELTPRDWTRGGSYEAQELSKLKVIEDELRQAVGGRS